MLHSRSDECVPACIVHLSGIASGARNDCKACRVKVQLSDQTPYTFSTIKLIKILVRTASPTRTDLEIIMPSRQSIDWCKTAWATPKISEQNWNTDELPKHTTGADRSQLTLLHISGDSWGYLQCCVRLSLCLSQGAFPAGTPAWERQGKQLVLLLSLVVLLIMLCEIACCTCRLLLFEQIKKEGRKERHSQSYFDSGNGVSRNAMVSVSHRYTFNCEHTTT